MEFATSRQQRGHEEGMQQALEKKIDFLSKFSRIVGFQQGLETGLEKGFHQGLQEGLQKSKQEDIIRILEVRFETISLELRELVGNIDELEVLEILLVQAVKTPSKEKFASVANGIT
ncbi:MAG: hypothetical protein F6K09_05675 [Merismopedia sp. SIO2A8]|nr:hypothetical protein [Symploca sp. SIO2B6]NET48207.1 hypothetical protein [Merismopedia sp. SIO2A8]